jgi:hypothetical protein
MVAYASRSVALNLLKRAKVSMKESIPEKHGVRATMRHLRYKIILVGQRNFPRR